MKLKTLSNMREADTERKTLTIAIPTYNRETFLREAIKSIATQTFKSIKIVLFDNASEYDIGALAKEFPTLEIEIRRNAANIGNQKNFVCIIESRFDTPFTMIFHDDDTMHPEYLREAVGFLRSHADMAWIGSKIRIMRMAENVDMTSFETFDGDAGFKSYSEKKLARLLLLGHPVGFSSVVYRTDALSEVKPDMARFSKWFDRPMMFDAAQGKNVAISSFPFVNYRIHDRQDSQETTNGVAKENVELIRYYKDILGHSASARRALTRSSIVTAINASRNFCDFRKNIKVLKKAGVYWSASIGTLDACRIIRFLLKVCLQK